MKWKKLGFLFNASSEIEGLKDTAGSPIPMLLEKNLYRFFSTARNVSGIGHTVYVDVDMDTLKIVNTGKKPCFYPGKRGCFDDNGVFLSSILKQDDGTILGWYASIGLCTSKDNGLNFSRVFEGPIIPLDKNHPYFTTAPYVIFDNGIYKMWFVSCHGWSMENDKWTHHYNIEYAESNDGVDWIRSDKPAIDFQDEYEYAIARPCVIKERGLY